LIFTDSVISAIVDLIELEAERKVEAQMAIRIFETSAGDVYAFPQDQELERVKRYLTRSGDVAPVTIRTSIDRNGAIKYWREDIPECWCRSYPTDHPEIPTPKYWDQARKVLPRKPETKQS